MPRLIIGSPHRYPDLARLWHRAVARDLVPAFERAGLHVEVTIFRDGTPESFTPSDFPGATLDAPRPGARDFMEFYDGTLERECDFLLFLDADVFVLDGAWAASYLAAFQDPDVAAISYLHRPELPGAIYALLCRRALYHCLPRPVFAAGYEGLESWPRAIHRDPGERAADALRARGKKIIPVSSAEMEAHVADFHATTNLRFSRELFGGAIGERAFTALIARKQYFTAGAYDNLLLGALYQARFGGRFAPGPEGEAMGGSLTLAALRSLLEGIEEPRRREELRAAFARSAEALRRLAAHEGVEVALPDPIPASWP